MVGTMWKVRFLGEELGLTGAEASVQRLAAGENPAFLHSHKTHEELYIIISGKGEYEVDGVKMRLAKAVSFVFRQQVCEHCATQVMTTW